MTADKIFSNSGIQTSTTTTPCPQISHFTKTYPRLIQQNSTYCQRQMCTISKKWYHFQLRRCKISWPTRGLIFPNVRQWSMIHKITSSSLKKKHLQDLDEMEQDKWSKDMPTLKFMISNHSKFSLPEKGTCCGLWVPSGSRSSPRQSPEPSTHHLKLPVLTSSMLTSHYRRELLYLSFWSMPFQDH